MRVLITTPCDRAMDAAAIVYQPGLAALPALGPALARERPDVLVIRDPFAATSALAAWRRACPARPLLVLAPASPARDRDRDPTARDRDPTDREPAAGPAQAAALGITVQTLRASPGSRLDIAQVMEAAEAWYAREVLAREVRELVAARGGATRAPGERVLLIGAGIVNLITAHCLLEAGYRVTLVDRCPDPRTQPRDPAHGATHGGGNARMYTVTEGDPCAGEPSAGRAAMNALVSAGGWLAQEAGTHAPREQRFMAAYQRVPAWLEQIFRDDIHALTRRSGVLWRTLMEQAPALFDSVMLAPTVLRLYADAPALDRARALHQRLGALEAALGARDLGDRYPALRAAADAGALAGGLEVSGFTLNIHCFAARLLDHLEHRGAALAWGRDVRGLRFTDRGEVAGVDAQAPLPATDHYVLSPGALPGPLLGGTRCDNAIHGLAGAWLAVPGAEPGLTRSLKVHGRASAEPVNITVARDARGQDILLVSAGHAYTGERALDPAHPALEPLFLRLEGCIQRLLPSSYERARASGSLRASRATCVRPFTPSGLGVFDVLGVAAGGRLIITGGHGTGGFAQAMVVAEAVVSALAGRDHPMHVAFHPRRGSIRTEPPGTRRDRAA